MRARVIPAATKVSEVDRSAQIGHAPRGARDGTRARPAAAGGELAYEAAAHVRGNADGQQHLPGFAAAPGRACNVRSPRCTAALRARRSGVGPGACGPRELDPDALTAPPAVLTIHRSKGSKRKDSRVDEEALIVWQDVLDMVLNGRPNEVGCPYCNHRPLTIEEIEFSTRISCSKCGKFIQGRFAQ
jgi:hypothetical protein